MQTSFRTEWRDSNPILARRTNQCVVIRGEAAIRAQSMPIAMLLEQTGQEQDVTLGVEYFLQNNALGCAPLLILIREGDELVAALYARERRVLGIRTGLVQLGDYYGEGCVIAQANFKARAFAIGALHVLGRPRVYWVRASFKAIDSSEVSMIAGRIQKSAVRARLLPETVKHILPLKDTFEAFLHTLGSHTRRNLRVYRRRVEQKQWRFIPRLSDEQVAAAFKALGQYQGNHESSSHYLNCCRSALKTTPGYFHAGICTDSGEWASLAAGWLRDDTYFMLVQLNDARYSRDSISTVMRSYLIEDLIKSNAKVVNFVGGCSEPLRQFCIPQQCAHYLFEKKSVLGGVRDLIAPRLFGNSNSMFSRIVRGGTFAGLAQTPVSEAVPAAATNELD